MIKSNIMNRSEFDLRLQRLVREHEAFLSRKNEKKADYNGLYDRYKYPVLTAGHAPLFWRFDMNYDSNPLLLQRLGINATFNAGAMDFGGKIILMVRVEGWDRKSFFAIAESDNGIDNFRFRDYPVTLPETERPDVNVYDMRLVKHEDGWIYGLFCTERRDATATVSDQSSAEAQCGIARTRDLVTWERLPDLLTPSPQQRNCVLHPEFVHGKYALYTRPMDEFISTGSGGGIGFGFCDSMERAVIDEERIIDPKIYHTINEVKNGQGPAPIKTEKGWLHLAHGVRNTASGLRYVTYVLLTDLEDPGRVLRRPGGYFIAPEEEERTGDVSNVVFSNGWVLRENGDVYIYYGSSDTRMHVATTTVERLLDYAINTPEDGLRSAACVGQRIELIDRNKNQVQKFRSEGRMK